MWKFWGPTPPGTIPDFGRCAKTREISAVLGAYIRNLPSLRSFGHFHPQLDVFDSHPNPRTSSKTGVNPESASPWAGKVIPLARSLERRTRGSPLHRTRLGTGYEVLRRPKIHCMLPSSPPPTGPASGLPDVLADWVSAPAFVSSGNGCISRFRALLGVPMLVFEVSSPNRWVLSGVSQAEFRLGGGLKWQILASGFRIMSTR